MKHVWPVVMCLLGPGVAQAYVGRKRAAVGFLAGLVLGLGALAFTIYGLVLVFVVWGAAFVDMIVHGVRKKTPRGETTPMFVALGAVMVSAALTRGFVAEAFKIPSSAMEPTLRIGDHVFVSKISKSVARGDLIVFQQPCQIERQYIKRVVALASETVEVRCGTLYVNGKPVPSTLVTAETSYQDTFDEHEWVARSASRYRETLGDHTYDVFHSIDRPASASADTRDFPGETVPSCADQRDFESRPSERQKAGTIVDTAPPDDPCKPHRHYVVPPGHVFTMGDNRNNSNDSRYWGSVPAEYVIGTVTGIWLPVGRFGPVD